jgi:hypothetical protein
MPPASAILSPLAAPFYPSSNMEEECPFSVIYSNGIPTGLINEHESIANIPDYTIDEKFPPTAVGELLELHYIRFSYVVH